MSQRFAWLFFASTCSVARMDLMDGTTSSTSTFVLTSSDLSMSERTLIKVLNQTFWYVNELCNWTLRKIQRNSVPFSVYRLRDFPSFNPLYFVCVLAEFAVAMQTIVSRRCIKRMNFDFLEHVLDATKWQMNHQVNFETTSWKGECLQRNEYDLYILDVSLFFSKK